MSADIVIYLGGIFILIFSATTMQITNKVFDLSVLSIPSVWYYSYLLLIFIPSFFIFAYKETDYRYPYIFGMASPFLTVPLGIVVVNLFCKFKANEIKMFYQGDIEERQRSLPQVANYVLLFCIACVLVVLWYTEQTGPVPLFYMLNSGSGDQDLLMLRENSFKLLDSPIRYLYHLTRDFIFPLLMLVAGCSYYFYRTRYWLCIFLAASFCGLIFAGANIAKGPVFSILLLLVLTYYMLKRGKLSWPVILIGAVLCLSFPILVIFVGQGGGFSAALIKVMERMFVAPAYIAYYVFEIVPDHYPFQMGVGLGPITKLLGKDPTDIAAYTAWYIMGEGYGTTSVAGVFIMELYGDFGFPGIIIGGTLIGIAMQAINVSIVRSPKTLFAIVVYVLFIYFFATLTYLTFMSALFLSGAPLLWILYKTRLLG